MNAELEETKTLLKWVAGLDSTERVLVIVGVAAIAHLIVVAIKRGGSKLLETPAHPQRRKMLSVVSLLTSTLVIIFYFTAAGFTLSELGVPIGTYFASASIIGLAVGFGSQGMLQDIVSGLTTIFSDLFDVGDMIEIGGQVGIVRNFGLRFTELENSFGARVQIPNRSVTSVINYPKGYMRCIADVTLADDSEQRSTMAARVEQIAAGVYQQFPGILLTAPSIEGQRATANGRHFLRIKFRIWPGRGAPIEESFRQEVVHCLKQFDADYDELMVAVFFEVEDKLRAAKPGNQREAV